MTSSAKASGAVPDVLHGGLAGEIAESVRALPEYRDHARTLPNYRVEAQAMVK